MVPPTGATICQFDRTEVGYLDRQSGCGTINSICVALFSQYEGMHSCKMFCVRSALHKTIASGSHTRPGWLQL